MVEGADRATLRRTLAPELPYAAWKDTCQTLQLWTQIVGKIRLARTPWLNHSWHVTLYVTARGLTTSPIPDGARTFQIDFDFVDHVLWLRTSDGHFRQVVLKPMHGRGILRRRAARARPSSASRCASTSKPNEIPDAIPFAEDRVHRAYDRDYANRFWRVLSASNEVFAHSAPASSARRARCISSGAASISR